MNNLVIKLIRHGESEANSGSRVPHMDGDYSVRLTAKGVKQAEMAGNGLGSSFFPDALIYCSPYFRTRETLGCIIDKVGVKKDHLKIYEDPRLREVERGYDDEKPQHELRKIHGWFYYRHTGGESPADCYDRVSSFLDSMIRNIKRKKSGRILLVSHGMVIKCFVMRFLHLTVEQFESMKTPDNGSIISICPVEQIKHPVFSTKKWAVEGLKLR